MLLYEKNPSAGHTTHLFTLSEDPVWGTNEDEKEQFHLEAQN
ncbi:hypothetical protein [Jeotgalibacillus proteolyticus]